MSVPELAPGRVEELLRGAPPETAREALVERLVRELRDGAAVPSPPLRERVRTIGERRAPRRLRPPARALALAAAALVAVSFGGYALTRPSGGDDAGYESARGDVAGAQRQAGGVDAAEPPYETEASREVLRGERSAAEPAVPTYAETPETLTTGSVPPPSSRARDVDMSLELRVRDADAVAGAANEAMRAVDGLGGHVVASTVDARGREGSARLTLRVPIGRLEDAVLRLSALGTITAQNVRIEDLQAGVDRRGNRVEALERAIRRDELRLRSGTLPAEERLEMELRLESLRSQLRSVRRARAELLRRATSAEIHVALHTGDAAVAERGERGLAATARDAWEVLEGLAGAALFVAIVASPVLLIGALAWALLRARGRRAERRLLDEPRPAGPRTAG